jgi:hypothetical protein
MAFWESQTGPRPDDGTDGRELAPGTRRIGVVACPECDNTVARLLESADGVGLRAWVPAWGMSPSDPGSRRLGWLLYTPITDTTPDDEDSAILACWKGHRGSWITGADCRAMISSYRAQGRRVRRAARPARPEGPNPRA